MKAVSKILIDLVASHGEDILQQPQRLKAMLADLLPHEKRMRYLLEVSLRAEIPAKLKDIQQDEKEVRETKTNSLKHYFKEEYFMEDKAVKSVFDCWLDVISTKDIEKNNVTDIDGNVYKTVQIGTQTWMAENLRVSKYRNGDKIPNVQNNEDWCDLETGAWSNYDNSPDNDLEYGKLYNWYAVDDKRGLAPEGWHVPNGREWNNLLTYLIGEYWSEGNVRIQADGLPIWLVNNIGVTNKDGFCAMPFGARLNNGEFDEYDDFANFWYSTECRFDSAWSRKLRHYNNAMRGQGYPKYYGLSVRCVKDEFFD